MTRIRTGFRLALLLGGTVIVASCGSGGDIDNELSLRMIQASPDTPLVNFMIDGVRVRSAIDYKGGYGFIFVTPGTYDLAIEAILPGDDALIIPTTATPLTAGKEYTYIVIGKDADDSIGTLAIENPIEAVPAGNARLQVAHAAPDAGTLDVYVTAPGDLLPAATPVAQVTYGNDPDDRFLKVAGTYVISITPANDPDTVLFDSSEITLQAGQDLLLVAVTNTTTATDEVPVSLIVSSRFLTSEVPDKDLPSDLRVVHVSPDAPALNVTGDPATDSAANVPFATGLPYLDDTGYVSAPRDNYIVNGATAAEPDTVIFSFTRGLIAGQRATVLALGLLANINDLVLADDIRPIHAEGKLRIVDAAPGSGTVDVYILESGTDIASVDATLRSLGLGGATTHLAFAPGNYTVTYTVAGGKTVLATAEVAATAGTVHTAILVDEVRVDETSDGKPPTVLLLDDLAG